MQVWLQTLMQGSDAKLNVLPERSLQVMQSKNLYIARARKNRKNGFRVLTASTLKCREASPTIGFFRKQT